MTAVVPPEGRVVLSGMTVSVSGVIEPDGQGGVRIHASRVDVIR